MDCKDDLHYYRSKRTKVGADSSLLLLFLPNEMLIKIMSYLPLSDLAVKMWSLGNKRIRLLCWEFCKYVRVKKEWDPDTARKVILMASEKMQHLILSPRKNDGGLNDSLTILALENSPNVRGLNCHQSALSNAAMTAIGKSNSLRHLLLGVENHTCRQCCPTFDALIPLMANLRNLTAMNLSWLPLVNDDGLVEAMIRNCQQLDFIAMPHTLKLSDELLNNLLEGFQERLNFISVNGAVLTDVSYGNLVKCKRLKHVLVNNALHLGLEGISAIAELSFQLEIIYLTRTKNLTGYDFVEVFGDKMMCRMRTLLLNNCEDFDDVFLQAIAKACPNLENLSVFGCRRVGDHGIRRILDQCKMLKELNVTRCVNVTVNAFNVCNCLNLKVWLDENLGKDLAKILPHCKFYKGEPR